MANILIEGIENSIRSLTERIFSLTKESVVFADEQFAEWFNVTVGIDTLVKKGGILCLKEFNSFQNGGYYAKGVFLISQPMIDGRIEVLKDIITSSQFECVTILTNLYPADFNESEEYYDSLKEKCLSWMLNENSQCEILVEKFPLALIPGKFNASNTKLFLNPLCSWSSDSHNFKQIVSIESYKRLVDLEASDQGQRGQQNGQGAAYESLKQFLDQTEKQEVESMVGSINDVLDLMEMQEDCYSVGTLSKIIATELSKSNESKKRRKNAKGKMTVLLIDRNLDLATVSLFHEETVYDKLMNILPELSPSSNDVQVDLRGYLFEQSFSRCLPGNFFHYTSDSCTFLIDKFLTSKPKECLLDVYRKLTEVLPASESEKKIAKINTETLKSKLKTGYKQTPKKVLEEIDLIQIISAYCQISDLKAKRAYLFDKLCSYVKIYTQLIVEEHEQSALSRLCAQFEKNDKAEGFSSKQMMTMLIYVYSLVGERCWSSLADEEEAKKLLVQRLVEDSRSINYESDAIEKLVKGGNHEEFVQNFFSNLRLLSSLRSNLKKFNNLLQRDQDKSVSNFKPLFKTLCDDLMESKLSMVLDDKQMEYTDIEYHPSASNSDGLRDLFKNFTFGYSKGNQNKAHPLNNDTLLIYFVGGMTSYEFKIAKTTFKDTNYNVLIGSSHFYNHAKLINHMSV